VSVPIWVAELAGAFWNAAGELEPFPRNLRRFIARAVPLTVVSLPKLSIFTVLNWLGDWGIVCELGKRDRLLRACLVARYGYGIAFVDGTDAEEEQRFSLAHELAHFLRDYWQPRRQVCQRLGPAALEVLDGERLPTPEERLHALLRHTRLGFHWHLLERDGEGKPATAGIADAEESADRLAYELLAPAELVLPPGWASGVSSQRQLLEESLQQHYGLPRRQAVGYAGVLLPSRFRDSLLRLLSNF
jgi:hypothetical protein